MTRAAFSLLIFSLYLFGLGAILIVDPNFLLRFFGVAETREVWIRVIGMLLLFLGFYDLMASREELRVFFRWTVPVRLSVIVFFAVFVLLGWGPPALLFFGGVDAAAAVWTALCLQQRAES